MPGVVGRQREFHLLVVAVEQLLQVGHAAADVLVGIERVLTPSSRPSRASAASAPSRPCARRHRVEGGFDLDDRAHQVGGDALAARVLVDRGVVRRALVAGDERRGGSDRRRAVDLVGRLRAATGPGRVGQHELAVGVAPAVNLRGRRRGQPSTTVRTRRLRSTDIQSALSATFDPCRNRVNRPLLQ